MRTKIFFKKSWISFAILIVGIVSTIAIANHTKTKLEASKKQDFGLVCNEIKTKITTRLSSHAQLLRSCASYFEASDLVTRSDWNMYIKSSIIDNNMPGIQGVGYSIIIKKDQLHQHIQQVRNEGFPKYKVWPEGYRDIYTSIIYLEPFTDRNLRAFWYDMYSEPVRRKAMENARDYDRASLTGKVLLVQETSKDIQPGTLMYVPVYQKGMPINTIEERRAAILGWVYSPNRMIDLMHGILGTRGLDDIYKIHLQIYDNDSVTQGSLLYDSQSKDFLKQHNNSIQKLTIPIVFHGKKWTLLFTKYDEQFVYFQAKVLAALISGFIISFLLFGLSYSIFYTLTNAEQIAKNLTFELIQSEANFKLLFDFNPDIIYIVQLSNSKIIEVNADFINQFGYMHDEIIGKTTIDLNIWVNLTDRDYLYKALLENGDLTNYEAQFRRKDGSTFTGIISAKMIDFLGKPHIMSVARDISKRKQAEELISESEAKLKHLFNFNPDIIMIARVSDNKIVEVNNNFVNRSGFTPEEVIGKTSTELNFWVDLAYKDQLYKEISEKGYCINFESELRGKDGNIYTGLVSSNLINLSGVPHILSVVRDITDRNVITEALKKEHQRLSSIIESTNSGTWEWNMQNGEIIINDRWAEMQGYTLEELAPVNIEMVLGMVHPDDLEKSDEILRKHNLGELPYYHIELRMKHKDGHWVWVMKLGKVITRSEDGKPLMMFGIQTDITERKQVEEELKDSREQLRNLASHLQHAREKERTSITLEIHDSLAQFLVALKMDIGMYKRKLSIGNEVIIKEEVIAEMEQLIIKTDNTINSARNIMNGLRPEQLELLGFVAAVEVYLLNFEKNHHIECRLENTILNLEIHPENELALFRVLQESLTNILKHSMASLVTVHLKNNDRNLILEIVDDGVGFDKNDCGRPDSYGLVGMKELIIMLGGKFEIVSEAGEGTSVKVEMPYGV